MDNSTGWRIIGPEVAGESYYAKTVRGTADNPEAYATAYASLAVPGGIVLGVTENGPSSCVWLDRSQVVALRNFLVWFLDGPGGDSKR